MAEDRFRPRLGRIGKGQARKRDVGYLKSVARKLGKLGAQRSQKTGGRSSRFSRSISPTKTMAARHLARRVIVKARFTKMAAGGAPAHLRYIQRDGVDRDGGEGRLFSAENDIADGNEFLDRSAGDRHQFRFIVSPEDAPDLASLRDFTRDLMAQVEKDLGTKLDWVAVEHHNTDNPHIHIVVRGVDDRGADLVIPRDYMGRGFRERAQERATLELGPRNEFDLSRQRHRDTTADRFTGLDREILAASRENGLDLTAKSLDAFQGHAADILARVTHLEQLGLAQQAGPGHWRLSDTLEKDLRALGERGDIIKTLNHALRREAGDLDFYQPSPTTPPVVGRVAAKGLADEHSDRKFLAIDGVDGRMHYVDVGHHPAFDQVKVGSIVEVGGNGHFSGKMEKTFADIAGRNGGLYTAADHDRELAEKFPSMSEARRTAILESHGRRLDALTKAGLTVEVAEGAWSVPADLAARAANHQRAAAMARASDRGSVLLAVHAVEPVEKQVGARGATWLDQEIEAGRQPLAASGFGAEVRVAIDQRLQRHLAAGLAENVGGELVARPGLSRVLMAEELERIGGAIARQNGLRYSPAKPGERIAGTYSRDHQLASGRFAQIDAADGRSFQLVPWRPSIEKFRGQSVAGIARAGGVEWTVGRGRSLPGM